MKSAIIFAALLAVSTAKPYEFFGKSNDFFSSFFSKTKTPSIVVSSSEAPISFSVQPESSVGVSEEAVVELSAANEEVLIDVTTVPTEQLVESAVSLTSEVSSVSTAKPNKFFGGSNDFFSSFFSKTQAPSIVVSSSEAPISFSVQPESSVGVSEEAVVELSAAKEEVLIDVTTVPTEQLVESAVSLTSEVSSVTERSDAYTGVPIVAVEVPKSSFVINSKASEEPNVDIFARLAPVVEKSKLDVQTVEVLDYPVYFNLTDYLRKCKRIIDTYFIPKTVVEEPKTIELITEGTTEAQVTSTTTTTTTLAPTTVLDVKVRFPTTTEVERYTTTLQPEIEATTFEVRDEIETTTSSLEYKEETVVPEIASVDESTTLLPTTVVVADLSPSSLATEKSNVAPETSTKIDFVAERFQEALVAKSKPGKPSEFLITFTSVDRNNKTTSGKHFLDYLKTLKK